MVWSSVTIGSVCELDLGFFAKRISEYIGSDRIPWHGFGRRAATPGRRIGPGLLDLCPHPDCPSCFDIPERAKTEINHARRSRARQRGGPPRIHLPRSTRTPPFR